MRRRLLTNDNGQSLVEFALVLPVLLLIVMGVMTLGLILYCKILVVLSASQGASVASDVWHDADYIYEEKVSEIQSTALTYLSNGISGTDRRVNIQADDKKVSVTVIYNYKLILPFLEDIFPHKSKIEIKYTAVRYID